MKTFTIKIHFDRPNPVYDNPMYVLLNDEANSIGRCDINTFRGQLEGKITLVTDTDLNENMFVYLLFNDTNEKFYYAVQFTDTVKPNTYPSTIKSLRV